MADTKERKKERKEDQIQNQVILSDFKLGHVNNGIE